MKVNQTDRDLEKLTSPFKEKVKDFIKDPRVSNIFVTEWYRTQERQEYLYNQVPKVTWTLTSMHTKGLAIDIAFNWPELYPSDFEIWNNVSKVAKEYWIDWGYDLWQTDMPHFQDNWLAYNASNMNKYTKILEDLVKNGYEPVFNNYEWDDGENKTLIEIWLARQEEKMKNRLKDFINSI